MHALAFSRDDRPGCRSDRAMATLSESAQRIRPGVFAELEPRIEAHTAAGGTLVPLHLGDTHLAPPAKAIFDRALHPQPKPISDRALEPDPPSLTFYRYGATAGLPELRDAIAARARDRFGIPGVEGGKHVHIGAGATHSLF